VRIGIDVGGTKIEGVALDGSDEVVRLRTDTPRNDYRATVDAIVNLVAAVEHVVEQQARRIPSPESRIPSVGVGIPGTIAPSTGLVKNANSTWLIGKPLLEELGWRLGRPVRIANDANCFAMSEAADGAGADAEVVFGVIVGTGTGAGVVVRGHLLTGANAIAGEWGHNPLPWAEADEMPGPLCYCGRHGCIETFLSGPGMAADHERRTGVPLSPPEIVEQAAAGDSDAGATLTRYEQRMARALASVINVLDPDVIVLGGGMSNIERLYVNVPRLWTEFVFAAGESRIPNLEPRIPNPESRVKTRLLRARHGDASGVRGAAWLWPVAPWEDSCH
jgi:fructokinase